MDRNENQPFLALLAISSLALAAFGCGDDKSTPKANEACNPLGDEVTCLLPWPSSAYLIEDPTTETGVRVEFPAAALPVNADGIAISPEPFNRYDGFPVSGVMLAGFPTGVSVEGLPPHTDVAQSMLPNASVIVVNMTTGERLPIFAEPDMNAVDPLTRALIIRPLLRMDSNTRYAVGIRNTVKAADGSALPVPEGFAKILANESIDHPLADRLTGYDEIFSTLSAAGMPKAELVLAWDFRTASDEFLSRDMLSMRGQAFAAMEGKTLSYEFEEIRNDNPEDILRFVTGTFEIPNFLSAPERATSPMVRDESGIPKLDGFGTANVAALVPKCVETATLPIPTMIFGHGMFGSAEGSLDYNFLQSLANEECIIVIAGEWKGLTEAEFASIAFTMNDINKGVGLTETLGQSVISFIVLQRMLHDEFLTADVFTHNGEPIIDPAQVSYFGASLGGIMGGVYMSYDPDVKRGVLGVPGGPWGLLFERSIFWPPLRVAMTGAYPNPWDYEIDVALMGMLFEKIDPIAMSSRVLRNPLPGTQAKELLLYMAMGDSLVANMASDTLARSLDIPVMGPSLRVPFGMEESNGPFTSGYTIYDEEVEPWPPNHNALNDLDSNSTHGDVHEWGAVRRQVARFLLDGNLNTACALEGSPAPCICPTGACE